MFVFFLVVLAAVVIDAWGLMLLVGMLHGWWPVIPTMAFDSALGISILLAVLAGVAASIKAAVPD